MYFGKFTLFLRNYVGADKNFCGFLDYSSKDVRFAIVYFNSKKMIFKIIKIFDFDLDQVTEKPWIIKEYIDKFTAAYNQEIKDFKYRNKGKCNRKQLKINKIIVIGKEDLVSIKTLQCKQKFNGVTKVKMNHIKNICVKKIDDFLAKGKTSKLLDYSISRVLYDGKFETIKKAGFVPATEVQVDLSMLYFQGKNAIKLQSEMEVFGVNIDSCISSAEASYFSLDLPKRNSNSYMIIKIGRSYSAVGVWKEGILIESFLIDKAGDYITEQVSKKFNISKEDADIIKCKFDYYRHNDGGMNLAIRFLQKANNLIIKNSEHRNLVEHLFSEIISEIDSKLDELGHSKSEYKILISGGSSQLIGAADIASKIMQQKVELASYRIPNNISISMSFSDIIGACYGFLDKVKKRQDYVKINTLNRFFAKFACFLNDFL